MNLLSYIIVYYIYIYIYIYNYIYIIISSYSHVYILEHIGTILEYSIILEYDDINM